MRQILLSLFLFCSAANLSAQYYTNQNKVWAFANGAGLDFSSGAPVAFTTGIHTYEACASVSNASGLLLFYTDGMTVYDRTGTVMPTGHAIVSFDTYSSSQGALILPVIDSPDLYYIFSLENMEDTVTNKCRLSYSIVNMTLNGGLGDVVSSSMGIPIEDSLGENMIAITGNNHNIWLLTHQAMPASFLAYEITAAGINTTPVVSTIGPLFGTDCYSQAMLRATPDRHRLAQAVFQYFGCYETFLYDFDPNTGTVSGGIVIDSVNTHIYGVEFSPDNSKLYLFNGYEGSITQYDISLPSADAIRASAFMVTDSAAFTQLKLGPDGKIYFATLGTPSALSCISAPNLGGASCGVVIGAVPLTAASSMWPSLPALFVTADTTSSLGINPAPTLSNISIYPNPAHNEITVTCTPKISGIAISNVLGQNVYSSQINTTVARINIADLPAGVYFVKVNGDETRKFIKR